MNDTIRANMPERRRREPAIGSRLKSALAFLGEVEVLADIGCDHGRFGVQAVKEGVCKRVIASDISAPSLNKARILAEKRGISAAFEFRRCGGFDGYSEYEADVAVLLGMGGELIAAILESGKRVAQKLSRVVMQPMRGEAELREYLYKSGYHILDETVCLDAGRYYQLIAAKFDPENAEPLPEFFPENWYQFGALALKKREALLLPMMERYLGIMEEKIERAAKRGGSPEALVRERDNTKRLIELFNAQI
ncbi:MAG: SAM-dependent methyltransferase [Clostridia bacterium]|nr:SAM-dependent methyltransferase [Clostridia bacterium]